MTVAIRRTHEINPAECRAVAQSRLGLARMTDDYIALLHRLLPHSVRSRDNLVWKSQSHRRSTHRPEQADIFARDKGLLMR